MIVSLLTAPEPAAEMDSFFRRLETSSDESPSSAQQPTRRQPLLLVSLLNLRRAAGGLGWRAYREDLSGFTIGWIVVIVLVVATARFLRS